MPGENFIADVRPHVGWWLTLHVLQLPLFGLMAGRRYAPDGSTGARRGGRREPGRAAEAEHDGTMLNTFLKRRSGSLDAMHAPLFSGSRWLHPQLLILVNDTTPAWTVSCGCRSLNTVRLKRKAGEQAHPA
jgi:hypothetical protein